MLNKDMIKQEIKYLKKENEVFEKEIASYPPGELRFRKDRKQYKWYHIDDEGTVNYIPKSQKEYAEDLAWKTYRTKQIKENKQAQELLSRVLLKTDTRISETMLEKGSPYFPLLKNRAFTSSKELASWAKAQPAFDYHDENKTFQDENGNSFRSKSECLIANALEKYGLPYQYEATLELKGRTILPDFTIIHPRTGQNIYWENFGMLDILSYMDKARTKLGLYFESGIYPGVNLIITCESSRLQLDQNQIVRKIRYFFF